MIIANNSQDSVLNSLQLSPLPYQKPLNAIAHGTRNDRGRQTFLYFVALVCGQHLAIPLGQ